MTVLWCWWQNLSHCDLFLQHAHAHSSGFFITQDSSFGNLILPVLPRLEPQSWPPFPPSSGWLSPNLSQGSNKLENLLHWLSNKAKVSKVWSAMAARLQRLFKHKDVSIINLLHSIMCVAFVFYQIQKAFLMCFRFYNIGLRCVFWCLDVYKHILYSIVEQSAKGLLRPDKRGKKTFYDSFINH